MAVAYGLAPNGSYPAIRVDHEGYVLTRLVPRDITDEMVNRALTAFWDATAVESDAERMKLALQAALCSP